MDTTYLPQAVALGAEIRSGARVLSFEFDHAGRIDGVVYRQGGQDHRQRCRAVFLCAGGVESPRLLLNWVWPIPADRLVAISWRMSRPGLGRFDDEMRMNRGYPSSLISEDMMRPADADCVGGYLMQSLGVLPVNLATGLARGAGMWGTRLQSILRNYNSMAGIGINGECLPHPDNRLTLSDETDAFGHRKALVEFSYHANEHTIDQHSRRS